MSKEKWYSIYCPICQKSIILTQDDHIIEEFKKANFYVEEYNPNGDEEE